MAEWWFRFEINKNKFSQPFFFLVEELENTWSRYLALRTENAENKSSGYFRQGVLANLALSNIFFNDADIQRIAGKPTNKNAVRDEIALINIVQGYKWIKDNPLPGQCLSLSWYENLNKIVGYDSENPNIYRIEEYWYGFYRAPNPKDCELLLMRLRDFINCDWGGLNFPSSTEAIIKAIIAHVFLFLIRPFRNANGRTSRLAEYAILKYAGFGDKLAQASVIFNAQHRLNYFRNIIAINKDSDNLYRFIEYVYIGFLQALLRELTILEARTKRKVNI